MNRAVTAGVDPLRAQVVMVGRAVAILAERMPRQEEVQQLAERVDAIAGQIEAMAPVGTSVAALEQLTETSKAQSQLARQTITAALTHVAEAGRAQSDATRQAVAAALHDAVGRIEGATGPDRAHMVELVAGLELEAGARRTATDDLTQHLTAALEAASASAEARDGAVLARVTALESTLRDQADSGRSHGVALHHAATAAVDKAASRVEVAHTIAIEEAVARVEAAHAAGLVRILDQVGALSRESETRQAQAEEFRRTVTTAIEQAVTWIESAMTTDSSRILAEVAALGAPLAREAEAREVHAIELRTTITATLEQALAHIQAARALDGNTMERSLTAAEAARAADAERLSEQVIALQQALAQLEAARTGDTGRVLDQVAALEGPLTRDAIARQAQLDDLRHTVAASIDQAVSRIETSHTTGAGRVAEQVGALAERAAADARHRDEQAAAMLDALDARLHSMHTAGTEAAEAGEQRLATRVEAVVTEHAQALVGRIDERTRAITDLEALPGQVAAGVHDATTAALTAEVEPLVARLVDAVDGLAHEGGRIEALARGHAGEARAVEERVAALFTDLAERAESAVDRSRARIAEGQVALGGRFDSLIGEMLSAVAAAAERLDGRMAESAEGLRAAGGHQNGALLDAVNRTSQQLGEALIEIRSTLIASGTELAERGAKAEQRSEVTAERLDGLRALIESVRHDPRLEALLVEQVAARDAQMTAIEAVSARIDEVGPVVARALLSEVERAARSASAAEEAVASLNPDALRAALDEATESAAGEVTAAGRRLDETASTLADQVGQGVGALIEAQSAIREELARLRQSAGQASVARLEEIDQSLAEALAGLGAAVAATRTEVLSVTTRALERSAAVASEAAQASGLAIDDLRVTQAALREAVQDGAHKAEMTALDVRGLRDRLTPHLVALAEATTRRADADQAGFDAVLARLDQLLTGRDR